MVDAYLSPILRRYVDQVAGELSGDGTPPPPLPHKGEGSSKRHGHSSPSPLVGEGRGGDAPTTPATPRLMFMQSNGGLTAAERFQGKDCIVSGPAGGVVGAARAAEMAGFDRIIGFDMGGTSTDVSHYAGEYERTFETQVAGVRMRAPMMRIHTVAAGGGSILILRRRALSGSGRRVAGANPGPACYRRGGPLTVTDANVMLGKVQRRFLPARLRPGAATRRWTSTRSNASSRSAERIQRNPATRARQSRWRRASSASPWRTWPTPSREISVQPRL